MFNSLCQDKYLSASFWRVFTLSNTYRQPFLSQLDLYFILFLLKMLFTHSVNTAIRTRTAMVMAFILLRCYHIVVG